MSTIALGVIGTGHIVRQGYLTVLPLIGDIGQVFLYDIDRAKADAVIETYDSWLSQDRFAKEDDQRCKDAKARAVSLRPWIHVLESAEDVISRSDVILVTTPPRSHLQVAQACLDAGKIVLIEKPLAVSSRAAREFACRNESVLDRVRYLENCKPLPTEGWRLNPLESGGGVLFDWGSHTFGLALYLAGEGSKVISVQPEFVRFLPETFAQVESSALSSIFAVTQSGRQVTLLVENSWECGSVESGPSGFWVSVELTLGRIEIHQKMIRGGKAYSIVAAGHRSKPTSIEIPWEFPHDSLYYSLVDSLQQRPSVYGSFWFGLQILDLVEETRGR